jgi:hypothetical protein
MRLRPRTTSPTRPAVLGAALGVALVLVLGLRSVAFGDYEAETLPAVHLLVSGDLHGFLTHVTGYGGATLLQAPFLLAGSGVGGELATYRAGAVPGLALLVVLALVLAPRITASTPARAASWWTALTAFLIAGSPIGLLAAQAGHPEELLVVGLAVAATVLAVADRPILAAFVIGAAAAAKPWALIAVPVVLCAATNRRVLLAQLLACGLAGMLIAGPILAVQQAAGRGAAPLATQTTGIFKATNLFWFAGAPNPDWRGATPAVQHVQDGAVAYDQAPSQRIEPGWVGRVSHPAVVLAAILVGLAFAVARGRTRRGADLLLLLAAVCWWRCLLDSWNTDYYALGACVALVAWQAWSGRPPVAGLLLALGVWVTFQLLPPATVTPDQRTLVYLAWALPVGVALLWRALAPASAARLGERLTTPLADRLPTLAAVVRGTPVA